jgi:hypothetical protein
MDSSTIKILSSMNERMLKQSILVQTLYEFLVSNSIITEKEFQLKLKENIEQTEKQINDLQKKAFKDKNESSDEPLINYFGPIVKA